MYIRATPVHQVRRQLRGLAAFSEADAAVTLSGRGKAVRTKNIENQMERIWMLQSVGLETRQEMVDVNCVHVHTIR